MPRRKHPLLCPIFRLETSERRPKKRVAERPKRPLPVVEESYSPPFKSEMPCSTQNSTRAVFKDRSRSAGWAILAQTVTGANIFLSLGIAAHKLHLCGNESTKVLS